MHILTGARTLVESMGATTASSVSKKVDFVVVDEDPGSKFDKARELGIKTLIEEEFKKMETYKYSQHELEILDLVARGEKEIEAGKGL
jgi:BRCT domain type II-containing protein